MERKTILSVEDEHLLQNALKTKLEEVGYNVITALTGEDGYTLALQNHPDVILLDIILPGEDGFLMLDKIRKDEWGKNAEVIILTNLALDDERLSKVTQDEPSYYLVKTDVSLDDILKKIESVLSTKKE